MKTKKSERIQVITGNFDKVLGIRNKHIRLWGIVPIPEIVYEEDEDEDEDESPEGNGGI